jgi:hypothetical protein
MKINFAALTDEERTAEFAKMDNDALAASLAEARTEATALFALESPTIEQVNEAEAIVASIGRIETEQNARAAAVEDAAKRFAAAKQTFSTEPVNDGVEDSEEEAEEAEEEESEEADDAEDAEAEDGSESDAGEGDSGEAVTTAAAVNHTTRQTIKANAAAKVGSKVKRPAVASKQPVTITAAADVQGFSNGQVLSGMAEVAKAVQARVKGFAPFNLRAAQQTNEQSGGQPVLHKFGAAAFGVDFDSALTAAGGTEKEYDAANEAVKQHVQRVNASLGLSGETPAAMAAAMAWCAPSEVVYNWIADYVVDGLLTLPEVNAPRGGLMMTEGPQLAQGTYDDSEIGLDGTEVFGFGGTEAEMEAGYVKTCETIECPEFVDHRLDFTGYCWKIPILTEKAFPELVADAMRLSDVLYAHKMNRRFIGDIVAASTAINATNAFGAVQVDTLEALTQVAIKERRWWNLGSNAVMEVKLPQEALEIFKFDMARRSGLALNDIATEQKIAAHFANHKLAVEYISDFDQRYGSATPTADWPETIRAIMYPTGTFLRAVEDVINLSAVYDAASLSANEYTGVFFEQGVMTIKRGYRSHVIEVPVCTAGRTGANDLTCTGFEVPAFDGSF